MGQAETPRNATPNPSLPKTIGMLNMAFGFVLLLCGAGCLRGTTAIMSGNPRLQLDPGLTKEAAREMRRNFVEELRQREEKVTGESEKARLRKERERIEARPETVEDRVDFTRVNRGTQRLAVYLWIDVLTGPLLNLLMLIAGVGLVRLKTWGLRLGIWVAALKAARLLALGLFLVAFVLPAISQGVDEFADTDFAEITSAKMQEDQRQKAGGGLPSAQPVALEPGELIKIVKRGGYIWVILCTCFSVLYPLVALIVLTRPAAAAAVGRAADDGEIDS
ncbi:MAG: hypothetical protein P4L84_15755 [Isosphaeraceae bacterium]|nr:hypothetical protein [Isosphaeraceae bacterium]